MKIAKMLRVIALTIIGYIIVDGVVMMIGDFMGVVEYNNQLLIVGLSVVLLSEFVKNTRLYFALLAIGLLLIILG